MAKPVSSTEIPTMADVDPHKQFVCPYHKYHLISAKKYPGHVANCRKMYSGDKFANCPFNHRHEFPAVEYDYHVLNCPDKNIIEKEISSVPAPNVPKVNHHPEWDQPSPTEDWEAEADRPGFSLSAAGVNNEERNQYDVIEDFHYELEQQQQQQQQIINRLNTRDLSGLSKNQKKNLKRYQKRKEKRVAETGIADVDNGDEVEQEPQVMSGEQKEKVLRQLAREYSPPGRQSDAFVDWVSILNQYCQKNKMNVPKYTEHTNTLGGFGAAVVVTTERFISDSVCSTKKQAKHSAARAALLGLNIAVAAPDPCRAPHQSGNNIQRAREVEESRQLLEKRIQSQQQQRVIPGLSNVSRSPVQQPREMTIKMAGVKIDQGSPADDEWHVVGQKPKGSNNRAPGVTANNNNNNSLRLAGRGRGRAKSR